MSDRSADALNDDWLDAALVADGREHRDRYLADDGFTARVAAALPPPDTVPAWRRPALIALWTAAGVGAAMALPGALTDVAREVYRVVGGHPVAPSELFAGIALLGSLALGGAAWALRED
jgi:hypothetical protein